MKIFTTYYRDGDGIKWSGQRIRAITYEDAEHQAKDLGLTIIGQLRSEVSCDENYKVDWSKQINYDQIQNN